MDFYSRRIIGRAMQGRQITNIVSQTPLMAVWRRKPKDRLLIHSDQDSQFTGMDCALLPWGATTVVRSMIVLKFLFLLLVTEQPDTASHAQVSMLFFI